MTDVSARPRFVTGGMVPAPEALPDVLPTDRITTSGKPVPDLRTDLRRIASWRNAWTVFSLWVGIVALWAAAIWAGPIGYAVAFLLMGAVFARLLILGHEAAHRLLFRNRRANDLVGTWLLDYPGLVPFELYRRSHFAHHKDEFGPNEPDIPLYAGYPVPASSWRRKLVRDAVGISGYKNLKPLVRSLKSGPGRKVSGPILLAQVVIWGGSWALTGRWWLYPLLWLGPWLTVWRVLNRLRAIAEHGGMERSDDRRRTTHVIRQSWAARFWIVPYNTGWHLAHHTDMGVPWRNLPRFHAELERAGWVTPPLEHSSYRAFWKACASATEPEPVAA